MPNANNFLTADERNLAEVAVAEAEQRTSAEIVCVVATESGRYDRAEALVGLFTALLFLLIANLTVPLIHERLMPAGDWDNPWIGLAFVEQALAVLIGFAVGNALASCWHGIRRVFVRSADMEAEAQRAAAYVLSIRRLTSTRHAGGLLLYVSLFEHRVVVLADTGVTDKLGQSFLDQLRETAVRNLKAGNSLATVTETVEQAAEQLSKALPHTADDSNELPNTFVCLHPRP